MDKVYEFFNKWNIVKITFWYRVFAYSFIVLESFRLKGHFNDYILYNLVYFEEALLKIVHSSANMILVTLVLIALEIQNKNRPDIERNE